MARSFFFSFSLCWKGPLALTDASVLNEGLPGPTFSGLRLGLARSCAHQICLFKKVCMCVCVQRVCAPTCTCACQGLFWAPWLGWTSGHWASMPEDETP